MTAGEPHTLAVRDIMEADPLTIAPDTPVRDVVRVMTRLRLGAMLIGVGPVLHGIFSERDLLDMAADMGPNWGMAPISDWMTRDLETISADAGWEDAMAMMERLHIRHLPVVDDGHLVGILYARQLMAHRAHHLNQQVERRTHELSERDRTMQYQLQIAGRLLNRALLPKSPPDGPDLAWAVCYSPLDALGGDYYDFVNHDAHSLGVLIADASGHSVPAAMVAVMARIAFAEVTRSTTQPAEVLAAMNARLLGLTEERFVTAFFARLDRLAHKLVCANAGHPLPIHYSARKKECRPVGPRGLMLGVLEEVAYPELTIDLEPGDRIVFYTDGVTEANNASGEMFGADRLMESIRNADNQDAAGLLRHIEDGLQDFRGDRPVNDDVTILVAEVKTS
jgi:phosphoserine phosphatase RsbU/P